ncbi:LTA synthase family protein [Bacillus taeanensis]|uniref:Glycerol phosphate lipoteichoic acid synthase n=1 Tax=Bacillus taeanensis TaxID=273032 RepID=A0A366XU34_9BACI|nr:LTA synthase family protein [Bacillus taeanensis]RBW68279.1 glycerol phosphate lipoteichoic acid synthase [Bacillus taeanensis]
MKNLFNKLRFSNNYMSLFLLAVILLWIKTYYSQLNEFNLGIENSMQEFLLFLNPLGSSLFFLGFALFAKGRRKYIWLIIINFLLSFLLFANIVYYRFFNDFITLPTLTQTQNFGDVSGSITSLLKATDLLFFLDTIILLVLAAFRFGKQQNIQIQRRKIAAVFTAAIIIMSVNLGLAETDRPQLLTRTFDRNYIVKYLGMYNYTIYDAVLSTKASAKRAMADSNDITEVINYTNAEYASPNPEYFGAAEGMNVIYLHLESIQNFLINYELHGEEVTPFLNSLTAEENTLYFDNFFHQTAQGKTSDAEFILENSLYGLPQGSAFSTKGMNTYQAAPAILGQKGYTSAVFHGNKGSFWNRNEIYKSFGYDAFYDSSYYELNEFELADYGLHDKPFFEQSIPLLESLPQPFYTKFLTVSHHYPYRIDQEQTTIEPHTTGDKSVDNYFQTARYADEALKEFFDYLKESGLYDNSVIIMYGDHYGISENHNKAMAQVLNKEITPLESAGLQRVPLFIRVPGIEGGTMHQYGGQIDLRPTLLHLLGIDTKQYIEFGTDLLSEEHDEVVPFRNGDFMGPTISYTDDKFYDSTSGEEIEATEEAQQLKKAAEMKLQFSDRLVEGDLLRFYTPEGFVPVDRSQYNYKKKTVPTTPPNIPGVE